MNLKPISNSRKTPKHIAAGCFGVGVTLSFSATLFIWWHTSTASDNGFLLITISFVLLLLTIGAAAISVALFLKNGDPRKTGFLRKQSATFNSAGRTGVAYDDSVRKHPGDEADLALEGPQNFKPVVAKLVIFVLALLFAILCNSLLVYKVYSLNEHEPYRQMIPLVGISFLLTGGAIYALLSLLNPKVSLALSTGVVERGDSFDIAWQLEGKTSRVKALTLRVEGEELAAYGGGNNRRWHTHVFCTIPLAKAIEQEDIDFGEMSVRIPHDVMHSFEADDNAVSWRIVVEGDIPWWPDIFEIYTLRVKP